MIDFDDLDEAADERVAAGDELDEAALAALSCKEAPVCQEEEVSLEELLGRSARTNAALGLVDEPVVSEFAAVDEKPVEEEPEEKAPVVQRSTCEAKSKRLLLCELTPVAGSVKEEAQQPVEEGAAESCFILPTAEEVPAGLPTETTFAESTQDAVSSVGDEVLSATEEAPAIDVAPPQAPSWTAREDDVLFSILGTVLPMQVADEATPQKLLEEWEGWGVAYARTLRFRLEGSKAFLNARLDSLPRSPSVVQLEGKASVLNALALSLRQRDERLREGSVKDAARRRIAAESVGDFGPRIRQAAAAKQRPGRGGRGAPFARRQVPLSG